MFLNSHPFSQNENDFFVLFVFLNHFSASKHNWLSHCLVYSFYYDKKGYIHEHLYLFTKLNWINILAVQIWQMNNLATVVIA